MIRQIEFALDGAEFTRGTLLGNKVNAHVADISFVRPLIPHPNTGETVGVDRIEFEVTEDETLETIPQIAVRSGRLAELFEDGVNGLFSHHAFLSGCLCSCRYGLLLDFLSVATVAVASHLDTCRWPGSPCGCAPGRPSSNCR